MMLLTEAQKIWILVVGLLGAGCLYLLQPILMPFFAGALLAYLCDPLVERLQAWRLQRTLAVLLVMCLFLLLMLLVTLWVFPKLQHQALVFLQMLPETFDWLSRTVVPWLEAHFGVDPNSLDLEHLKVTVMAHWEQASSWAKQILKIVTQSGFAIILGFANLLLIPVVMFYLLRDWQIVIQALARLIPRNLASTVIELVRQCDEVLGAFIRGQLLVMVALSMIYGFGLWLVGIKMALLIGVMAGLLSIVPYLGLIIGLIVALLTAVVQFGEFYYVAMVLLVFGLGQVLEAVVLTPVLVGDKIGLHPVAVIFAVLAGGQLFGFVGILLALPVAAIIMVWLRYWYQRYLDSDVYRTST